MEGDGFDVVLRPRVGWRSVDLSELFRYRDLFRFLVWRGIKVRYAQSALGVGWAVLQPLVSMLVFTLVFGVLTGVDSEGVPYAVFSFVALVPWTFFANALTDAANSLIGEVNMVSKIYFPRMLLPLSTVVAKLVDFVVAMLILVALLVWYRIVPNTGIAVLPLLVLLLMTTAAGAGMWLAALAIQYRDVKYAMSFGVQLLMFAAPVVYPASAVPARFQLWYALNPMVGVIEGFRAALLGTRPMPWDFIAIGAATAIVAALGGALYFRGKERLFADVA